MAKLRDRLTSGVILASLLCMLPAATSLGGEPEKKAKREMNIGFKAAKRGYWLEALLRFETANKLTPNQPQILNNIAVAMEASGRFEEAMVTYESAIALAPDNKAVRSNYSRFKEFYDTTVAPPESTPEAATKDEAGEGQQKPDSGEAEDGGSDDDTTSG